MIPRILEAPRERGFFYSPFEREPAIRQMAARPVSPIGLIAFNPSRCGLLFFASLSSATTSVEAPMTKIRGSTWALCTLGSALLLLTGCDKLTQTDLKWARAALERNPNVTVVATDDEAKTITVQVKGSAELRVVRVDEIVGAIPQDEAASAGEQIPTQSSEPALASTQTPEAPAPAPETAEPATASGDEASSEPTSDGKPSGSAVITNSAGRVIASSDGASAPASSGKVLASGPGYTITAGEARRNAPIRLAEATELKSPANVAVEHRYEPMICQGNRLIQINGRNLEFEGDAVSALDGCEIHITNSHIIAGGVGLTARGANVYVKNSIIEGTSGSISASQGAKVYTQQSTFKGLSRRLDTATFTDLGGTNWN
jgi:hypothetical protein